MRQLIKFTLFVSIFFISQAYAVCHRNNVPDTNLYLDMGTVVVSPNLAVGAEIKTETRTFQTIPSAFKCEKQNDPLHADVITTHLTLIGENIYQTNIPGIGVKFLIDNKTPFPFISKAKKDNASINISGGPISMVLYKTAKYVGSGPITAGQYTRYGVQSDPNGSPLNTYLSENGTIIVAPSCYVTSGVQQNVYLSPINHTQLNKIGATAGETPFFIQLQCSGGSAIDSGYDNVNLTFDGSLPAGMKDIDGVLINSNTSSSGAQGIGIQVLDDSKKPLQFNKPYTVGSLAKNSNSYIVQSDYIARYYRYANKITSGKVESKMVFNITYD